MHGTLSEVYDTVKSYFMSVTGCHMMYLALSKCCIWFMTWSNVLWSSHMLEEYTTSSMPWLL